MPATELGRQVANRLAASDASTGEIGAPGVASIGGWLDTWEDAPDLRFPLSSVVFDKMRRDPQIDAIMRAISLPIRRTHWYLDGGGETLPNGRRRTGDGPPEVSPEVMALVRTELGLNEQGARVRRRREGIVFDDLIRHALLMLPFGFMPMEQVYEVGPPSPGQDAAVLPAELAHVRKLAPRMPRSVRNIDVARDGGLNFIRQQVPAPGGQPGWVDVDIPADRLVMFVNEREGGDWSGRSIFRSSYGSWLIKNRLVKVAAVVVERNGLGVPVVTGPEGGEKKGLAIATAVRAGAESGAYLPTGYTLRLVGVEGNTVDALPVIQYHDQAMGRAALAMFLNLGHDNGARALGDTFVDYFVLACQAVVDEIEATVTEYVIRDLVALNFGEDEPYPDLTAEPIGAESNVTAEALAALADKGLLGPMDPELVDTVRRRYGLPEQPEDALDEDPFAPAPANPFAPTPPGVPPAPGAPPVAPPGLDITDPKALAARALYIAERLAHLAARPA